MTVLQGRAKADDVTQLDGRSRSLPEHRRAGGDGAEDPGRQRAQDDGAGPLPVFDDAERWLEWLRLAWAGKYIIALDVDADPAWIAWRTGDKSVMLTGRTPQELNAAIRADRPRGEIW